MKSGFRHLSGHVLRGFPRTLARRETPLEHLRSLAFAEKYRAKAPFFCAGIGVLGTLLYPFVVLGAIAGAIRHLPRFGVPARWKDFLPMYAAALLHNIPPVEYLMFGFADPLKRQDCGDYLYWMDQPALQWLNRQRGAESADVQDKARFAAICRSTGLPHAEVLAEFRDGRQVAGTAPIDMPAGDLWVKPALGSGGHGCRLWRREPGGDFQSGGETLQPAAWAARLVEARCIVQKALENHPGMAGLTSGGAAVVIRLVTVLDRLGTVTLIGSSVALPQGESESTAGAIGCVPDLATGTIRKVSLAGADSETTHPDTGKVIVGTALPCWRESCDFVMRAHREAFPAFASLGWDVVVTPGGPVLLEANSGWGTMGQQMDFGPLGRTPLAGIATVELERAQCG